VNWKSEAKWEGKKKKDEEQPKPMDRFAGQCYHYDCRTKPETTGFSIFILLLLLFILLRSICRTRANSSSNKNGTKRERERGEKKEEERIHGWPISCYPHNSVLCVCDKRANFKFQSRSVLSLARKYKDPIHEQRTVFFHHDQGKRRSSSNQTNTHNSDDFLSLKGFPLIFVWHR